MDKVTWIRKYCHGQITLHVGPMGSGKTTSLLKLSDDGLVIKYHPNISFPKETIIECHGKDAHVKRNGFVCNSLTNPESFDFFAKKYECMNNRLINIDEAGFFPDVVEFIWKMSNRYSLVSFSLAALDLNSQYNPMPNINKLKKIASTIIQHKGVCSTMLNDERFDYAALQHDCEQHSVVTAYLGDKTPGYGSLSDGQYAGVCDSCWTALNDKVTRNRVLKCG